MIYIFFTIIFCTVLLLNLASVNAVSLSSVLLQSTDYPYNTTDANLTAFPQGETECTSLIYDWRVNNDSITLVNMPFDTNISGNGEIIRDYSISGNNGTIENGTTWINSTLAGGSYILDGDDDSIIIPGDTSLNVINNTNYSIEIWIYPNYSSQTNDDYIIAQTDGSGTGLVFLALDLNDDNCPGSNKMASALGGVITCTETRATSDVYHVILTVMENGTQDQFKIYINGTLDVTNNVNSATNDGADWLIGRHKTTTTLNFEGLFDVFRIYNRTLTPEQISTIYNNEEPIYNITTKDETELNDVWQVCVTPNNVSQDGLTVCSNNLTIILPVERPFVINKTTSFCYNSDYLYRLDNDARRDNGKLKLNEYLEYCTYGCNNYTMMNLGLPGCRASPILQFLIFIAIISIIITGAKVGLR